MAHSVHQVDLLALGALQQPFLPLFFLECAFWVHHVDLPCNDGANDDAWCYYKYFFFYINEMLCNFISSSSTI
jgi:hypothetical protein